MGRQAHINFRGIVHILGIILMLEGVFMSTCIIISLIYGEPERPFLISTTILILFGLLCWKLTDSHRSKSFGIRESFIIVSLAWFLLSLFGTLPYLISRSIPGFTNALFESVSGFTTTGASILNDIESLPYGILFWRSLTHWIGGMGIVVLAVALLPFLKIEGVMLFNNESSGIMQEKLSPRIGSVAKRLWIIYAGLTLAETLLLWAGDMNLFDAVCHSFGTIATGGFSTRNSSIAGYSPYAQYVISVFMILSGINFTMHYFGLKRQFRKVFQNEELKYYLLIIAVFTVVIATELISHYHAHYEEAFRRALFQVSSIITATGFATDDYMLWPNLSLFLIFLLMFVGASAGSTGGGIKVIRHVFLFKKIKASFKQIIHGTAVIPIKINNQPVDSRIVHNVLSFIAIYLSTFIVGSLLLIAVGVDFHTSIGGVISCMGGIGPGLAEVGPVGNYAAIPIFGKDVLMIMMMLGRLELFSIFVIFTPQFWRN